MWLDINNKKTNLRKYFFSSKFLCLKFFSSSFKVFCWKVIEIFFLELKNVYMYLNCVFVEIHKLNIFHSYEICLNRYTVIEFEAIFEFAFFSWMSEKPTNKSYIFVKYFRIINRHLIYKYVFSQRHTDICGGLGSKHEYLMDILSARFCISSIKWYL